MFGNFCSICLENVFLFVDYEIKEKNEIEILDHVYELTLQHRKKIVNERRFVDVNIVFKGIEYLRFLMESLPPATVPG